MSDEIKLCACGCGLIVANPNPKIRYYPGHTSKTKVVMNAEPRPCACGCGQMVTSKDPRVRFIRGHSSRDPELMEKIQEKLKKTNLEKYGVECVTKLKSVQEKIKQTCIDKYGVDNASKSKEVIQKIKDVLKQKDEDDPERQSRITEKRKNTIREKYGVESVTQLDSMKEKSKQTCLMRYGTEYVLASKEFRESFKPIFLEKYGVEYPGQIPDLIEKNKKHFFEKYGVDNPSKSKEVLEVIKKSNLEKFGVEWSMQNKEVRYKANKHNRDIAWMNIERKQNAWIPLFSKEEFTGWTDFDTGKCKYYKFKCAKCGHIAEINNSYYPTCPECNPSFNYSKSGMEINVGDFISNYIDIKRSIRKIIYPKELDIYIPSKNLAIEFNGLYWHSINSGIEPSYHLDKTTLCGEKGIQLIHIFEDEWILKQDIVKSRLRNLIGSYDKVIYARKCYVKVLRPSEYEEFLIDNHLQGHINSSVSLGLMYDNELVSVMTFGPYRKSMGRDPIENEYEMYRFCNKLNYHIPGSASKLFKYFVSNYHPKKVISYADRRWSQGKLYDRLGFKFVKNTQPNYWYARGISRENRFKYRKSELSKLLENFDPNKTEQQNMIDNGYLIVYDCGSCLYEWNSDCKI